ncbi:histidinol-phosphate transaminase [Neisseriaceae bacterium TC5R-5]|nr:histidinol-phosphate transaminase [Neisseriaceae bacterium TC5R-5]
MKKSVQQLVRDEVQSISAYPVADATGYIKLDAMENPWPLPEELRHRLAGLLADVAINRYPDPAGGGIQQQLKQVFAIPEQAEVILGNGSDELITLITQALARPGAKLLALEPSFVMYRLNASFSGMQYIGVPLQADFSLNLTATLAAIAEHQPAVVFVSYPNNPTGPRFARAEVAAICEAAPGLVVVDEAYQAFASDSFMNMVGKLDNLLVMRTLSKLGLAGIRLGYAAASSQWINELNKVRPPYNINVLTQAVASFALQNIAVFEQQAAELCRERSRLFAALANYPIVQVFPSEANFITIRVNDAVALYQHFKNQQILVKKLDGSHPLLAGCLRLTVGAPHENDAVLAALNTYFA